MLKRQDTDSNWFHLPDPCRPGIFSPKLQSVWETVQIWIKVSKIKMESQRKNKLMVILDWFFNEFMIPHPLCLAKYHLKFWQKGSRDNSASDCHCQPGSNREAMEPSWTKDFGVFFWFQTRHKPVMIPALRKSPDSVAPHNSDVSDGFQTFQVTQRLSNHQPQNE